MSSDPIPSPESAVGGEGSPGQEKDQPRPVGYRRPPRGRPFRPGQSGNPNGRPRRARTLAKALARALDKEIEATEDGRPRSVTKLEAAMIQVANQAANGDRHALNFIRAMYRDDPQSPPPPEPASLGAEDSLVVAELIRRFGRPAPAPEPLDETHPSCATPSRLAATDGAEPSSGRAPPGHLLPEGEGDAAPKREPAPSGFVRLRQKGAAPGFSWRGVLYRFGADGTVLAPAEAAPSLLVNGIAVAEG